MTRTSSISLTLLAFLALADVAGAASRRAAVAPKLTEETLVPDELFAAADAKRFAYPNGFEQRYEKIAAGHLWKLTEPSLVAPAPAEPAAPAAEDALAATPDEAAFVTRVGILRPTLVTLVFADSAAEAAAMVERETAERTAALEKAQREAETPAADAKTPASILAINTVEKDAKLAPNAILYQRQVDFGTQGGIRRGVQVVCSKGNVFLRVDAFLGLKDGAGEAPYEILERRAREVTAYLLRKM